MKPVFEEFERERDERIKLETLEMIKKVLTMLKDKEELEIISKETGFSLEQIQLIQDIK